MTETEVELPCTCLVPTACRARRVHSADCAFLTGARAADEPMEPTTMRGRAVLASWRKAERRFPSLEGILTRQDIIAIEAEAMTRLGPVVYEPPVAGEKEPQP